MTTNRTPTRLTLAALAATLLATGCANMDERQQGTAKGAAIGTVAGAVLGAATGGKNTVRGAAIGGIAGAIAGNVWSRRMEEQRQAMEQATAGTGVDVVRTQDNQLKLNIPSDVSFSTGSAALQPQLRSVLQQFADGLRANPGTLVRVVGHTDNVGSDATNNSLSVARADTVRDFLEDRGVSRSRIETAGRGEREPIASNDTADGRAKNRRVEIFLREPEAAGTVR
ncbi:OmpA family protein [uncultured Aquabacterium sp.]|uniref:OmpA family protein n=1 Tax=uncultured Aquabacterium sp. TaxID=158753 RepID=UPI002608A7C0|nr:OmpA family protein [uncultured Aquabacterium sp.]